MLNIHFEKLQKKDKLCMNTNRILILKINSFKKSEGAIKNGLSRDTGNTGNTRHRTKTNKAKNKTQ